MYFLKQNVNFDHTFSLRTTYRMNIATPYWKEQGIKNADCTSQEVTLLLYSTNYAFIMIDLCAVQYGKEPRKYQSVSVGIKGEETKEPSEAHQW